MLMFSVEVRILFYTLLKSPQPHSLSMKLIFQILTTAYLLVGYTYSQVADSSLAIRLTTSMNDSYAQAAYSETVLYADSAIQAWTLLERWEKATGTQKVKIYALGLSGRFKEANDALALMEATCKSHIPEGGAAWGAVYNSKVALSVMRGEYDRAVSWSDRQLAFWGNKKSLSAAGAFINRGVAYFYVSQPWNGITSCQKGLQILDELGKKEHAFTANAYLCIGRCFLSVRHFRESEQYFQKALDLYNTIYPKNHPNILIASHNMASLYHKKEDFTKAIEVSKANLQHFLEVLGADHYLTGASYFNIGQAQYDSENYEEAEKNLNKALAIRTKSLPQGHPDIAMARLFLGRLYASTSRYEKSLSIFQTAIDDVKDNREFNITYDLLASQGVVYQQQGKWDLALAHTDACLDAYKAEQGWRTTAHKKGMLEILVFKARLLVELEDWDKKKRYTMAAHTFKQGRALLDSMRYLIRPEEEADHAELAEYIYSQGSATCFELYTMTLEKAWLEESFIFTEKRRASLLLQSLRSQQADAFAHVPQVMLDQERKAHTGLIYSEQQWEKARSKGGNTDSSTLALWREKMLGYQLAIDSIRSVVRKQYPAYYRLKYFDETSTLSDVQKVLADNNSLYIQYSWTPDSGLLVFYCTKNQLSGIKIPVEKSLTDSLQGFIDLLKDGVRAENKGYTAQSRQQFADWSHQVFKSVLAPVLNNLNHADIDKLIIVPHGKLGYIPFEILLQEKPASDASFREMDYVNASYTVRYMYSASLFTSKNNRRISPSKLMTGFAPDYPASSPIPVSMQTMALRDMAPLMQNGPEVRTISTMMHGDPHYGGAATESRFKSQAKDYRILHLAMHAFVNDSVPLYSSLIFAQEKPQKNENPTHNTLGEDGQLFAYEIYNLSLRAELVVLSACQTGYGKQRQGEGIMSLAHAFRYAGCPNIVTSLWQADDQSTAKLMEHFYMYLKQGMPKDEALQQARVAYLKEDNQAHPFFWASFVLLGDEKPVSKLSGARDIYTSVWIVFALLTALGIIFLKKYQ